MTSPQQPVQAHARKRNPLPWILLAVFIVAAGVVLGPRLLGGDQEVSAAPVAESTADPMAQAANKCDPDRKGTKLSDNNSKLTVSGAGEEQASAGISEEALTCILDTLEVPGALSSRIHNTLGEDGLLQGSWPGYKVTWTNNKASGIDLTVVRAD
jgi:hypothetical protein